MKSSLITLALAATATAYTVATYKDQNCQQFSGNLTFPNDATCNQIGVPESIKFYSNIQMELHTYDEAVNGCGGYQSIATVKNQCFSPGDPIQGVTAKCKKANCK